MSTNSHPAKRGAGTRSNRRRPEESFLKLRARRVTGQIWKGSAGRRLNGVSWQQRFGGAKLLTVWGEIKGPMAEYAGTTFTMQQSLDLLAYLLQQNGLPAGTQPLADTRILSDTPSEQVAK